MYNVCMVITTMPEQRDTFFTVPFCSSPAFIFICHKLLLTLKITMHLKVLLTLHRSTTHEPLIIQSQNFLHVIPLIDLKDYSFLNMCLFICTSSWKLQSYQLDVNIFTFQFHYASKGCTWQIYSYTKKEQITVMLLIIELLVQVLDHLMRTCICKVLFLSGIWMSVLLVPFLVMWALKRTCCFEEVVSWIAFLIPYFQSTWCWHSHTVWDPEITFTHI